ncbi:MAG: hypothetical protein M1269_05325 [Chloroflexi bacterium]|nr:hypothetical protein [Chloroflexota bacterium]
MKQLWKIGVDNDVNGIGISNGGEGLVASIHGVPATKEVAPEFINGSLIYIEPDSGKIKWKYTIRHLVYDLKISSGGDYVLAGAILGEFALDALFFDKSGNLLWKIEDVGGLELSEDGKYILVMPGMYSKTDYTGLFNSERKLIWKISESEGGFYATMSPDGRYVMTRNGIVFDRLKNIEWKINEEIADELVRSSGAISKDSLFFILPDGKAYDWKGKHIRVYNSDIGERGRIVISFNDKYVLRSNDKAALYNASGKLLWKIDMGKGIQDAVISTKSGYVILGVGVDDKHSKLVFLDLKTGKKIGEKVYEGEEYIHLAMPGDEKHLAIACGKNIYYYELLSR